MAQRRIVSSRRPDKSVTHPAFIGLVILIVSGAAIDTYLYFNQKKPQDADLYANAQPDTGTASPATKKNSPLDDVPPSVDPDKPVAPVQAEQGLKKDSVKTANVPIVENVSPTEKQGEIPKPNSPGPANTIQYIVAAPRVYFHTKPDTNTRREAFINQWNKAVFTPLDDQNGFIYVIYTNHLGQKSRGWLLKKDLKPVN